MKAVRIEEFGGLEVLQWADVPEPTIRPGQVIIKVDSSGVNYADIMRRQGNYPGPDLPSTLGLEAAGTIVEVGEGVEGLNVGQKVVGMGPQGNAEYVSVNANYVFPYPESLDPVHAGGMPIVFSPPTTCLRREGSAAGRHGSDPGRGLGRGDRCHPVGQGLWSPSHHHRLLHRKAGPGRSLGADETINYVAQDFEEEVRQMTGGNGVELILECVGGQVLEKSVRCVASYGKLISYGNASGTAANLSGADIFSANRTVIGFSMGRSPAGRLDHPAAMAELFPMLADGRVRLVVDRVLPMSDVAQAHQHLSNRGTHGKVILTP